MTLQDEQDGKQVVYAMNNMKIQGVSDAFTTRLKNVQEQ